MINKQYNFINKEKFKKIKKLKKNKHLSLICMKMIIYMIFKFKLFKIDSFNKQKFINLNR